jgi:cell division protein FtsL
MDWTRERTTPLVHIVIAVVFLVSTLIGSLALRTQMVQNAFEETQVQDHISQLTQDVEDDQAKLDELQASLPSKAQDMGMIAQQGSISIDLNGYQSSGEGTNE